MIEIINMERYREGIERLSTNFSEKDGMPPVCGRIINYLFLKTDAEATFEELITYFQVSKSAVSNALKMLEQRGVVISKTRYGQRKRYFSINVNIDDILNVISEKHIQMKEYIHEIMQLRSSSDTEVDKNLRNILKLINLINEKYPQIIAEFRNQLNNEKQ